MTRVLAAAGNTNFLVPNATIFVELVLFLIILFIFWKFIIPPLSAAMRKREEMNHKMAEDREEATRRLHEAEERYQAALADARKEAAAIRDEARADAQRIRDEMRAQVDREVARFREQGEQQLAEQRAEVVAGLRNDIGDLSGELAARILGSPAGEQQATVDRFLAEVDQQQPAARQRSGGAS